jgi:hypothetical protein
MSGHTGTTLSPRRGFALASAISMVTLFGFTSVMGAHANNTVTITAEIALCDVFIMSGSEADLEMGQNTTDDFVFTSGATGDFIDVDWGSVNGDSSCVGQLWAKRGGIMKGATPVADAELSLTANAGEVAVKILETYESVSETPGLDMFYAKMLIPRSNGAGTYTTTVDFTVDVSAPQ